MKRTCGGTWRFFYCASTDGSEILMWRLRLRDVRDVAVFLSVAVYMCRLGEQIQKYRNPVLVQESVLL